MDIFLVYVVIFGIVVGIHYKIEEFGVSLLIESEKYISVEKMSYDEIEDIQYGLAKNINKVEFFLFATLAILFMFFPLATLALASLILALLTFLSVA